MNTLVELPIYPSFSFTIKPPKDDSLIIYRPDKDIVEKTKDIAKAIFVEAFTTTYTDYHKKSSSADSIEKWLRLKEGLSLKQWLCNTFEGEYEEYKTGLKGFVHIVNLRGELLGWISHSPVSKNGELYLSQCSLEGNSRGKKIATTAFVTALKCQLQNMFPGVKEVKLIARKINEVAYRLYTRSGFTKDETIDPAIYGESYDDRYVGYRRTVP